ncbi:MAG TPA: sensor histidine kinase [Thermoanaerobaculia bacterium]|nr:sensor histidine kinase [Thermoanaerobaculia bacterium]
MNAANQVTLDYTPQARAERLIAAGRFVLAFFSLVTVYLEPSTPARYREPTYALLVVYTAYALVIAVMTWRSTLASRRWRLVSHILDLVLFSIFVFLTEGPASPFFLYFVFSLFCATLRFSWRGILATAVAAIAVYTAMAAVTQGTAAFAPSRFLMREVYLGVTAALLVYLGMYQERLRRELASLAAWPRELEPRIEDLLRSTLAHAAAVLDARNLTLAWEESEEPWVYFAMWDGRELHVDRIAPGAWDGAVPEDLRNTSFFARREWPSILLYDPRRSSTTERGGSGMGEAFWRRAGGESFLVVSVASETLAIHLVVPAVTATADELALAHVAGRLVLATLEQYFFLQQVRQTASAEERMRISRELHDGIVQSLGGVGLQLQAIRSQLQGGAAAAERLEKVQQIIEHDQRELRTIVRELRPYDVRDGRTILFDELQRLSERFPLEWGLEVEVDVPTPIDVSAPLAHELCRIVNESLSNAARHGGASHARVALRSRAEQIDVRVSDNGRGFPFTGRFDLHALDRDGYGPRTLKERVKTLGGSLTIHSSDGGAVIEAHVPVESRT